MVHIYRDPKYRKEESLARKNATTAHKEDTSIEQNPTDQSRNFLHKSGARGDHSQDGQTVRKEAEERARKASKRENRAAQCCPITVCSYLHGHINPFRAKIASYARNYPMTGGRSAGRGSAGVNASDPDFPITGYRLSQ